MKRKAEWMEALDKTIKVWATREETCRVDSKSCPLCDVALEISLYNKCTHCIVFNATGDTCMDYWEKWAHHWRADYWKRVSWDVPKPESGKTAGDMVFYLLSLRSAIEEKIIK